MVDWGRLLSGCTFTGTAGSNPVLSVSFPLIACATRVPPIVPKKSLARSCWRWISVAYSVSDTLSRFYLQDFRANERFVLAALC